MPDCGVEYGEASYKGLTFEALPSESTDAHRIITHLYPFSDEHYNERLGRAPKRFKIKGAFHGEDYRDQMTVAERVWMQPESGEFYEPTANRRYQMDLVSVTFGLPSEKLLYVEFTLELVEAAGDPYPSSDLGTFGQIPTIISEYQLTVRDVYLAVENAAGSAVDVITAIQSVNQFLENSIRQNLRGLFPNLRLLVDLFSGSGDYQTNFDHIQQVMDTAADADAPIDFYRQMSEVRITGTPEQEAQAAMTSSLALGYYFEQISKGINYDELERFRERAIALKGIAQDQRMIHAIDQLIIKAGQATNRIVIASVSGQHHALVASYLIYGNIDRASDIMSLSGGISGAAMQGINYECVSC